MKSLAVIPARGGSKRIPRKNVRDFLGKPIISYSIEAANGTGVFDEVMVSTEDAEIAGIAKTLGAQVPFLRSLKNADDHATISDVLGEVLDQYKNLQKMFDAVCVIYPAAPFVTAERVREGLRILAAGDCDAVWYVVKYSYPIQRALKLDAGRLEFIHPENIPKRSQDLTAAYHDAGQLFWIRTGAFERERSVVVDRMKAIELPEREVQDIDTPEDWELAEVKYRLFVRKDQRGSLHEPRRS